MNRNRLMIIVFVISVHCYAQVNLSSQDTTINNLVHGTHYQIGKHGELGEVKKSWYGKQAVILIPGLGFDASVFNDFIDANKKEYTMYTITSPGFGKTPALPMPPEGTSYGEQNWNKEIIQGIAQFIEKEKIKKPVFVGHFTQGAQISLRMAIDYPEKAGGVIVLGAPAKFLSVMKGKTREFSRDTMTMFTDTYTSRKWFKHMRPKDFDGGNYLPEIYSLDSVRGAELWNQVASVPLPIMVRYACEFFASDIKPELNKIQCPVLILRATFTDSVLNNPINSYLRPQFIDAWNDVSSLNPLITVRDIPDAGVFLWKDKPGLTYGEIKNFIAEKNGTIR